MAYTTRQTCRVCDSSDLTSLFSLGKQYVNNFVNQDRDGEGEEVPIDVELCNNCTLVQLKHTAPQAILYSRYYWYRSGTTKTMRDALRDITKSAEGIIQLQPNDVVLDIGSNDGTLLRSYSTYVDNLIKVGVEPANNLIEVGSQGVTHFINGFWDYENYWGIVGQKAKVITAIGMFYDLEDPNQFIGDVAKALSGDGVFIAQLMCLKNVLNLNDVGTFAHEHLEFYSFKSLQYLLAKHGLSIFRVETNKINGESYRIYASHEDDSRVTQDSVYHTMCDETGLNDVELYQTLFRSMEENRLRTYYYIKGLVDAGKRVWVYGASTKGNVILQYYGLDHTLIEGASEKSEDKWGKYTVGTMIPIYSEEEARECNPDYFLVLPYAFLEEFIEREHEWVSNGGKFIVPLPELKVI